MKIVMADADLTEFDWLAFAAAIVLALGVVLFQPPAVWVMLAVIGLIHWSRKRRQRAAEATDD